MKADYLASQISDEVSEGQNGKRFLYESGRKHFLRFDHLLVVLRAEIHVSND